MKPGNTSDTFGNMRDYDAAQAVALFAHLADLTGGDMFIPLHRTMRDDIRGVLIRHGRVIAYQFPDWKTAAANLEKAKDDFVVSERQSILADIDHAKTDLKLAEARLDGLNAAERPKGLTEDEYKILTRLAAGEQLIALTAAGVTWGGEGTPEAQVDLRALLALRLKGYVIDDTIEVYISTARVPCWGSVITELGRAALGKSGPDNAE